MRGKKRSNRRRGDLLSGKKLVAPFVRKGVDSKNSRHVTYDSRVILMSFTHFLPVVVKARRRKCIMQ